MKQRKDAAMDALKQEIRIMEKQRRKQPEQKSTAPQSEVNNQYLLPKFMNYEIILLFRFACHQH